MHVQSSHPILRQFCCILKEGANSHFRGDAFTFDSESPMVTRTCQKNGLLLRQGAEPARSHHLREKEPRITGTHKSLRPISSPLVCVTFGGHGELLNRKTECTSTVLTTDLGDVVLPRRNHHSDQSSDSWHLSTYSSSSDRIFRAVEVPLSPINRHHGSPAL